MKLIEKISLCLILSFVFFSCSSDDDISLENRTKVAVKLIYPEGINTSSPANFTISFKEINSGTEIKKETNSTHLNIDLINGNYKISVDGVITKNNKQIKLSAIVESLYISGIDQVLEIVLTESIIEYNDLLFEEIYYTGSKNSQTGIPYFGDRYFKLYNNSDEILYTDGLLIAESEFTTDDKQDYSPDIMNKAFATGGIIMLPGSGKEYPIPPRSFIIIAESATNHNIINSNYINLSSANFEMYNPYDDETADNPQVPNVDLLFNSISIDKKGVRSYVIARLPQNISKEKFITDYNYHYTYNELGFPMEGDAMSIPNEWIIDAVNLSNGKDPEWIVTSPALDNGWATCSLHEGDESRYGKSVKRKTVTLTPNKILKDTNNSREDFESGIPSLKN